MHCTHCGGEKIQVVSHYVENKKKKAPAVLTTILVISCIIFVIGAFFMLFALIDKDFAYIQTTAWYKVFEALFRYGLIGIVFSCLLKGLVPYNHKTKIVAVCLDCGHAWEITVPNSKNEK